MGRITKNRSHVAGPKRVLKFAEVETVEGRGREEDGVAWSSSVGVGGKTIRAKVVIREEGGCH